MVVGFPTYKIGKPREEFGWCREAQETICRDVFGVFVLPDKNGDENINMVILLTFNPFTPKSAKMKIPDPLSRFSQSFRWFSKYFVILMQIFVLIIQI